MCFLGIGIFFFFCLVCGLWSTTKTTTVQQQYNLDYFSDNCHFYSTSTTSNLIHNRVEQKRPVIVIVKQNKQSQKSGFCRDAEQKPEMEFGITEKTKLFTLNENSTCNNELTSN